MEILKTFTTWYCSGEPEDDNHCQRFHIFWREKNQLHGFIGTFFMAVSEWGALYRGAKPDRVVGWDVAWAYIRSPWGHPAWETQGPLVAASTAPSAHSTPNTWWRITNIPEFYVCPLLGHWLWRLDMAIDSTTLERCCRGMFKQYDIIITQAVIYF